MAGKRGRPKGSVSKKAGILELIKGIHDVEPAIKLAEIAYNGETEAHQLDALKALLPYCYTRKPVEVSHEAKGQVSFKMVLPGVTSGDNAQVIEHKDE